MAAAGGTKPRLSSSASSSSGSSGSPLRRRAARRHRKLEGGWPERVLTMQRNWIGRSEGAEVDFSMEGSGEKIRVFTTRIDTIFGATCVILAPGTSAGQALSDAELKPRGEGDDRRAGHARIRARSRRKASSPAITRSIRSAASRFPIWVGNFVLMGYGTGAIMAVPAHDERDFEFCTKYGIPIRPVIRPVDGELADAAR